MRRFLREFFALDHFLVVIYAIFLMWLVVTLAVNISFLNPLERAVENFSMTDVFYDISSTSGERDSSDLITLVDMTDVYDRSRLADIVDSIQKYEPALMGVDIVFEGWRGDTAGTERIIEAICGASSPMVWAYKMADWNEEEAQFESTIHSVFADYVDVNEGYTNVIRDTNGGTVRSFGISRMAEHQIQHSLPATVATTFLGDTTIYDRLTDQNINFTATIFPVLQPDSIWLHPELIRGRIVMLGATHDGQDMHFTPIGKMAGLEVLAYTIQTMVEHRDVKLFSGWQTLLFTLIIIWLGQLCQHFVLQQFKRRHSHIAHFLYESEVTTAIITFFILIILVGICFWLFFTYNVYINTAWAMMGIALLLESRDLYKLTLILLYERYHWPWLKRSVYADEIEGHK
ncbi:MAG: CHASE2 domain-containing protein [Bacteroidaceae bacterium]|nr:CHASE2 domain-containing protein [Bacteroidaceae bacterium]